MSTYKLPGDPNLPPGVTHRMIDEAAGSDDDGVFCIRCDEQGDSFDDTGHCPQCAAECAEEREAEEYAKRMFPEIQYNEEREATLFEIDLALAEVSCG